MVLTLISKEIFETMGEEGKQENSFFYVCDRFLFYRGIKIAICNYPTVVKNKNLLVQKENILEKYEIKAESFGFKYEIDDSLFKIFDKSGNLTKIFTINKAYGIGNGTVIIGNRSVFLNLNGDEVEINYNPDILENLLCVQFESKTVLYRKQSSFQMTEYTPNTNFNTIKPDLKLVDGLFTVDSDKQEELYLFTKIPNDNRFLVINKNEKETIYNTLGVFLVIIDNVFVCKGR